MTELFRLKIASKRQVTVPQRLLNLLQIGEGDEIQIEVIDGQVRSVDACKVVPTRLFTPDVLAHLASREADMLAGKVAPVNPKEAVELAVSADEAVKAKAARTSFNRSGREADIPMTAAMESVYERNS